MSKYTFNLDTRNKIRKELKVKEDVHVYGHVGRFVYAKNHQFLLNVFSDILKKDPNSYLLLVGDGELKSSILKQAKELKIEDRLLLPGLVNNVHEYLQAMDYFIFPSNYEGLGIALVEAQAAGLRCIKSDVIPNEVDITDLVEASSLNDSSELWAEKICQKVDYSRQNMAEIIKKAGYDIQSSVDYLTEFYEQIYSERK